jgi:hypothetical protein
MCQTIGQWPLFAHCRRQRCPPRTSAFPPTLRIYVYADWV